MHSHAERWNEINLKMLGVLPDMLADGAELFTAGFGINQMSKKFDKNGKSIGSKIYNYFKGGELPASDSNPVGESHNQSSKSTYDNQSKKSNSNNFHNESPRTTNFAGQPNEFHPSNQSTEPKGIISRIGERFKLAGEALEHGGRWKRLSLAAGVLIGGSAAANASETVGKAMSLFDPISQINGTDAGSSAYGGDELQQIMAKQKNTVPQHIQQAFTQPKGYNTMKAIEEDNKEPTTQPTSSVNARGNNLQPVLGSDGKPIGLPSAPIASTVQQASPSDVIPTNPALGVASSIQSPPLNGTEMNTSFQNQISSLVAQQYMGSGINN